MTTSTEARTGIEDFEEQVKLAHYQIQSLGVSSLKIEAYDENPEPHQRLGINIDSLNMSFEGKYADLQKVDVNVRIEALNRYEELIRAQGDVQGMDRAGYEVLTDMLVGELAKAESQLLDLELGLNPQKLNPADKLPILISSFPRSVHEEYFDRVQAEWGRAQMLTMRQRNRLNAMDKAAPVSTPEQ